MPKGRFAASPLAHARDQNLFGAAGRAARAPEATSRSERGHLRFSPLKAIDDSAKG